LFFDFVLSHAGGLFEEGGHILLDQVRTRMSIAIMPRVILITGE
jgi:hypothetical protein